MFWSFLFLSFLSSHSLCIKNIFFYSLTFSSIYATKIQNLFEKINFNWRSGPFWHNYFFYTKIELNRMVFNLSQSNLVLKFSNFFLKLNYNGRKINIYCCFLFQNRRFFCFHPICHLIFHAIS